MTLLSDAARWGAVAALTGTMLPAATLAGLASPRAAHRGVRAWAAASRRALGLRLTIDEHNRAYDDPPYLFVVLDQASLVESFVYPELAPVPMRIVMNVEYALIPVLGWSCVAMGGRVVVRQWPAQAKRAIAAVAEHMRATGASYAISAEGRRSPDGALSPYKKGPAVLAIAAQARIVPLYIEGARDAMPFGEWRVRPGAIHATVLPAMDMRGATLADRDRVTRELRALGEACRARSTAP